MSNWTAGLLNPTTDDVPRSKRGREIKVGDKIVLAFGGGYFEVLKIVNPGQLIVKDLRTGRMLGHMLTPRTCLHARRDHALSGR